MKINTEPVRGTRDFLPNETRVREFVRTKILSVYQKYGFSQIVTPIMEDINLLLGSDGGDNLKLIFKILKRGEKLDLSKPSLTERDIVDIGLRYDLTVPLVRLFSNNQSKLSLPFKAIQIGDSFRADRPQRGRLRQFTQCDIDILGDPSINAEIDLLNTSARAYQELGFKNFTFRISDRRVLSDILSKIGFPTDSHADVCVSLDKMDKIGSEGVMEELSSKKYSESLCKTLVNSIEKINKTGLLGLSQFGVRKEVVESLTKIVKTIEKLAKNEYKIVFDISIVRGQGYYTGTVYELYLPGFSGACGGGGRYDSMIENMTGKPLPAVGFSIGFEPTCMIMMEKDMIKIERDMIAVVYHEEDDFLKVIEQVENLSKNADASAVRARKNLSFQLQNLKENGFTKYTIVGRDEIKSL